MNVNDISSYTVLICWGINKIGLHQFTTEKEPKTGWILAKFLQGRLVVIPQGEFLRWEDILGQEKYIPSGYLT